MFWFWGDDDKLYTVTATPQFCSRYFVGVRDWVPPHRRKGFQLPSQRLSEGCQRLNYLKFKLAINFSNLWFLDPCKNWGSLVLNNYQCDFHSESFVEWFKHQRTTRNFRNENRTSGYWELSSLNFGVVNSLQTYGKVLGKPGVIAITECSCSLAISVGSSIKTHTANKSTSHGYFHFLISHLPLALSFLWFEFQIMRWNWYSPYHHQPPDYEIRRFTPPRPYIIQPKKRHNYLNILPNIVLVNTPWNPNPLSLRR
jgi:hypothetical protein